MTLCAAIALAQAPAPGTKPRAEPATKSAAPAAGVAPATDPPRLALVVGNASYPGNSLRNPVNDAKAMAAVLRELGFDVLYRENVGVLDFRAVIREFARRAQADEGIALFYYAGHAVSIEGRNYLVPVDIHPTDEEAIRDDSIDVEDAVLSRLERSKKQVRMVILDSCRDNPFRSARTRSLQSGLVGMAGGDGSLVAYSTGPGRVAEDGQGQNSLFTGALVTELRRGGEVVDAFRNVGIAVDNATNKRQVPYLNVSLSFPRLYLRPGIPEVPPPNVAQALGGSTEEQDRIDRAIAAAEVRNAAERARLAEERARDKARIDAQLKAIVEEQERDRQAREALERQQRAQIDELITRFTEMRKVIAETEQIRQQRPLTNAETQRVSVALAETETLQRRASDESNALTKLVNEGKARDDERAAKIAALAAQSERLNVPIAPQRPRIAADGTLFVRGVSLPPDLRIEAATSDVPPECAAFRGAWGGRWDGYRTVELWVAKVERDCTAAVVYGRGGLSVRAEAPRYERSRARVAANEMKLGLADGAQIVARNVGGDKLDAVWSLNGRVVRAQLHRLPEDPAAPAATFAEEDADYGARPRRYFEVPSPDKPLPVGVPGVKTLSTLELKQLLDSNQNVVLIDAYSEGDHMTIPGALWRPDIGVPRPGVFPLREMEKMMSTATSADLARPVVVFERSVHWGWYGYNAALRLLGMGYTSVYWYRGGLDAWADAGYPMAKLIARETAKN